MLVSVDSHRGAYPVRRLPTKVAHGTLWSAGGQVIVLVGSVLSTPFITRLLGPERYGVLGLVSTLVAYLVVTDLGTGRASTRFGAAAITAIQNEKWGEMVALQSPDLVTIPIEDVIRESKRVDPGHDIVQAARATGISLGD